MEDQYLALSGIQHFCFCRRQWALIHLEQQWQENLLTAQGRLDHTRCHDPSLREKRGDLLLVREMRVVSHQLKLTGACDLVEFRTSPQGVPLQGMEGLWQPFPVEYKHGRSKDHNADRLQLCAQAIALEEMLACSIPQGALYYVSDRHREPVELSPQLREETFQTARQMEQCFRRGHTPKVRPGKQCNGCSLKEICLPVLCRKADPAGYIRAHLEAATREELP